MKLSEEMTCTEMVELVTEYLEGGMAPDRSERFEEHLVLCPGCTAHMTQMRSTIALAGRLQEDDLEPAVAAGLLAAFRGWRVQRGEA